MAVPGRVAAARLLLSLQPPGWFLAHSRAVAEVAGWLALRANAAGSGVVDRAVVEAAALLHDADKLPALRTDAAVIGLPHGEGSAGWLRDRGFDELADPVAAHPVVRLGDDAWWSAFRRGASVEARVVAYADKRAGQRLESLDARFASWRRRYPPGSRVDGGSGWDDATIARIRARAAELEADVCGLAGVAPEDVRRLAWTGPALAAAGTWRGR